MDSEPVTGSDLRRSPSPTRSARRAHAALAFFTASAAASALTLALALSLALPRTAQADPVHDRIVGPAVAPRLIAPETDVAVFSYEIDRSVQPGPGMASLTPRDGQVTPYPMALVDWQPLDRLSFTAGRQLCNSTGPSAHAIYALADHVDLTFGFRFERTRFRLTPQPGSDLGSIGVEQSAPAFATLRLGPPNAFIALVAGAELRGKLRIEDERGGFMAERLDRPSPFAGIAGRVRF